MEDYTFEQTVPMLVFSDICIYREGLKSALCNMACLDRVLTAESAETALEQLDSVKKSVVLVDLASARADELLRQLQQGEHRIAVLTLRDDPRELLDCVKAGAVAFLSRNDPIDELIHCIRALLRGESYYSPSISSLFVASASVQHRRLRNQQTLDGLTPRQVQIMSLMGQGLSNKDIARTMHLEVSTVKNHVHNILGKLNVKTRGQAAAAYRTHGVTAPSL